VYCPEKENEMRKALLVIAVIVCVVTGAILLKTLGYYRGGDLARKVEEIRAQRAGPSEAPKRKTIAQRTSTKSAKQRSAQSPKRAKPIELDKFYGKIELMSLQKSFAEQVVAELEEQHAQLYQEVAKLRKEVEQQLWSCLDKAKQKTMSLGDLRKIPINKMYEGKIVPNIEPRRKQEAETIYKQFLAQRKEINKSLQQSKRLATRMLFSLLTPEQKKIYRLEHPPKTSSEKKN
jgi:hypothetical protein